MSNGPPREHPDSRSAVVLAQPTRARLYELLVEAGRPLATGELAELADLHPNGVRNHLERLAEAGLVERGRSTNRRGRPRDEWTAIHRRGGRRENGDLVRWLARAYPDHGSGLDRIEAIGREAGVRMDVRRDKPERAFVRALEELGFEPVHEKTADGFNCRLGNCPYRDAVRENQPAVCSLHRGLTRGLLEQLDPDFVLREFQPFDPDRAGCLIGVDQP